MKKLTVIFVLIMLTSCQEDVLVEFDLSGEEKYLIEAWPEGNSRFEGVRIQKSIPVGQNIDISLTEVTDAEAYLIRDSIFIYPLHYAASGRYLPKYTHFVKKNSVYELYIEMDGKQFYAETKIPDEPVPSKVKFWPEGYLTANISASPENSYGALWALDIPNGRIYGDDFHSIIEVDKKQSLQLQTKTISERYRSLFYRNFITIKVFEFDKPYSAFFNSVAGAAPKPGGLSLSTTNIVGNVEGDNVIGVFIGFTSSSLIKPENL